MDEDGGEVQAFYENELQKRFELYEHLATGSGDGASTGTGKPADT
jgi:pyruvate-ferredoxin/flavodoxin oxidoreductase